MNFQLMSVQQLQAFVRANNIACKDRRYRIHLEAAIAAWEVAQSLATEAKEAAIECAAESVDVAALAEVKATELVVKAVEVLTSPTAIAIYKGAFRVLAIAIAFTVLMSVAALKWCWSHRQNTAIWHWVNDAIASETVQNALDSVVVLWRTIAIVFCAWRDWGRLELTAIRESIMRWLGMEAVSIELQ